ncbi:PTS mannose/fructose/sorbose transporter family subunit IID [candidate division KSB1 bacterium]|nr:PTS mannose/fructose/sorbose transporter family subunit IID [candidate division KSB1 bacterium]
MAVRTRKIDRFNIFIRCFFIQASWSFKALIGMGFCFCVIPLARRLYDSPKDRSEFLRRHLDFFNSHPYFVTYCLGAVTKLEEQAQQQQWPDWRPISIFKERLTGPLGVQGDQLFWNRIKPMTIAIGMVVGLTLGRIALPVFLLIYNIPHFYIRIKGWRLSYRMGFDIVSVLSTRRFQAIGDKISILGLAAAGALISTAAWWSYEQNFAVLASFCLSAALTMALIRLKVAVKFIILAVTCLGILVGLLTL